MTIKKKKVNFDKILKERNVKFKLKNVCKYLVFKVGTDIFRGKERDWKDRKRMERKKTMSIGTWF